MKRILERIHLLLRLLQVFSDARLVGAKEAIHQVEWRIYLNSVGLESGDYA